MRRREFIGLLGSVAAWPSATRAQQHAMSVIGLLSPTNLPPEQLGHLNKGLNDGGYFEGRNLAIIYRTADGQFDRLPALAADLVERNVSVILAVGSPVPARVAKAATAKVPIVFAYGGDPASDGLVASFNRPGANVTGVTFIGTSLTAKKLELVREIVPAAADVALLVNSTGTIAEVQIREAKEAAQKLGQRIQVADAGTQGEIDKVFATMKFDALVVGLDPIFATRRTQIISLAARNRIPTVYGVREYCDLGGLASYGASLSKSWAQAGLYVARILKGEKPADLPVMQPSTFELVINLKTAKALGLSISRSLISRADDVIE
jgi:putative ABC transport system substrate-binding protein